jgi:glutathionyl-hydroquinone reductase
MGMLIEGRWSPEADTRRAGGRFLRTASQFRDWITRDGSPGAPAGNGGFKAEPGRYHLYVSLACPWASRTLIFRKLKGLEDAISVSIVDPLMLENGWQFSTNPGCIPDTVNGTHYLWEIYRRAKSDYTGKVTVPVLWDKKRSTIVSNESAEIIRMLNSAFDQAGASGPDFYPAELRAEIDQANARIYDTVNNGVYRAGFATTQAAYDEAFDQLFDSLDWLDSRLSRQRYLVGDRITEADWRLFTTLVRFDAVYHGHFKCNRRKLIEYPNLWPYARELFQVPGVAETVNLDHIRQHYYGSHRHLNPSGIVAHGPEVDFMAAHNRARWRAVA